MTAYVNVRTSIVRACLPWYNPDDPKQHTKHTRESILKLMAGMNNDTQPLAFRSKHFEDGSLDRYFPGAPGWTNLTRGKRPKADVHPLQHGEDAHRRVQLRAIREGTCRFT